MKTLLALFLFICTPIVSIVVCFVTSVLISWLFDTNYTDILYSTVIGLWGIIVAIVWLFLIGDIAKLSSKETRELNNIADKYNKQHHSICSNRDKYYGNTLGRI